MVFHNPAYPGYATLLSPWTCPPPLLRSPTFFLFKTKRSPSSYRALLVPFLPTAGAFCLLEVLKGSLLCFLIFFFYLNRRSWCVHSKIYITKFIILTTFQWHYKRGKICYRVPDPTGRKTPWPCGSCGRLIPTGQLVPGSQGLTVISFVYSRSPCLSLLFLSVGCPFFFPINPCFSIFSLSDWA